ncbi:hypothetical protein, partial [Mycobacterium kansasii]|uniref:hypothetical protein n=1 Tax=Mycobacterium kansasii TaxID=1768 RepID=UPI00217F6491
MSLAAMAGAVGWPRAEWGAAPAAVCPAAETVAAESVVAAPAVAALVAPGVLGRVQHLGAGAPGAARAVATGG